MVFFTPLLGAIAIYAGFAKGAPAHGQTGAMDSSGSIATMTASLTASAMGNMMTPPAMGFGDSSSPYGGSAGNSYSQGGGGSSASSQSGKKKNHTKGSKKDKTGMGNNTDKTKTLVADSTSSAMMTDSTSMVMMTSVASSTMMTDSTSSTPCTTSTSQNVYSTPSYGSGSSSWGGSGSPYDSCVQKCAASYGGLSMTYSAPPSTTTAAGSNSGGGMTHTVIVAPTQGILRYVPFVVNASVGDTVEFVWGANNHTVTKSSQLAVCNKTSAAPFASGEQNKTFTFSQMVNDTNATFFYCGTPGHCEKGMFGIINPPNAVPGSNTSVASMMSGMASNSSNVSSMNSYTNNMTSNNTVASNWGGNIDMSGMPEWSYQYIAENVMYTRTFLAANPQTLNADGTVSLGNAGNTPMVIPNDITSAANSGTPSSPGSSVPSAAPAASVSGNSPYGAGSTNGARRLGSSDVAIGFVVAASLALVF